jgi:hypothetical protein
MQDIPKALQSRVHILHMLHGCDNRLFSSACTLNMFYHCRFVRFEGRCRVSAATCSFAMAGQRMCLQVSVIVQPTAQWWACTCGR